jgi:hypothetical protein
MEPSRARPYSQPDRSRWMQCPANRSDERDAAGRGEPFIFTPKNALRLVALLSPAVRVVGLGGI